MIFEFVYIVITTVLTCSLLSYDPNLTLPQDDLTYKSHWSDPAPEGTYLFIVLGLLVLLAHLDLTN